VGGGEINHTARVELDGGRQAFLKWSDEPIAPALFHAEERGLGVLRSAVGNHVPKTIDRGDNWLLLAWVEPAPWSPLAWERLGRVIAALHGFSQQRFGLDHDNFIGRLPQDNGLSHAWPQFWLESRIEPMLRQARKLGVLDASAAAEVERAAAVVGALVPEEPARLVHGDLWSGNVLADADEQVWLVDPAVSYSHRETDLAFMRLFGGFDERAWAAYGELLPIADGFEERCAGIQLYPLLVHALHFGGEYVQRVRSAAAQYL